MWAIAVLRTVLRIVQAVEKSGWLIRENWNWRTGWGEGICSSKRGGKVVRQRERRRKGNTKVSAAANKCSSTAVH